MRRNIVRALAISALLLAIGTTAPATSVFAGQGGGGDLELKPGQCVVQDNGNGTANVAIGMGPVSGGLATKVQLMTVSSNAIPRGCTPGTVTIPKLMDPIPFDDDTDTGS